MSVSEHLTGSVYCKFFLFFPSIIISFLLIYVQYNYTVVYSAVIDGCILSNDCTGREGGLHV